MRPLLLAGLFACATAVAATAQTVTVDTAAGSSEVPAAPQSVVVFDPAAVDTISALGQPIAGLPAPLYLEGADELMESAETVGTLFEPDFEALAVMQPDLIVVGGRSSAQAEPLASIAPTMVAMGGGSIKSKPSRSLIPIALSCSSVVDRLVRWISGTAVSSISSRHARSVYSR